MAILKIKHNSQLFADLSAATSGVVAAMENAQVGEFWAGDYGTGAVLAFKGVNGVSVFSDAAALTAEFKASLQNYYTKEEIDTLFNTKLSKYYTKDELDAALDSIVNSAISVVGGDGIIINGDGTEKTISTNVELEIKTVEGKEMIQLLDATDKTKVLAEVDASKFVVDGMLSSTEIVTVDDETELPEGVELSKGKYIKLSWNTDSGKSDTYVPVADLISEHKVVAGEDVAGEFVVVATNVVESTDENGVKVSTVNVTVDDTAVKSALDAKIGKDDTMIEGEDYILSDSKNWNGNGLDVIPLVKGDDWVINFENTDQPFPIEATLYNSKDEIIYDITSEMSNSNPTFSYTITHNNGELTIRIVTDIETFETSLQIDKNDFYHIVLKERSNDINISINGDIFLLQKTYLNTKDSLQYLEDYKVSQTDLLSTVDILNQKIQDNYDLLTSNISNVMNEANRKLDKYEEVISGISIVSHQTTIKFFATEKERVAGRYWKYDSVQSNTPHAMEGLLTLRDKNDVVIWASTGSQMIDQFVIENNEGTCVILLKLNDEIVYTETITVDITETYHLLYTTPNSDDILCYIYLLNYDTEMKPIEAFQYLKEYKLDKFDFYDKISAVKTTLDSKIGKDDVMLNVVDSNNQINYYLTNQNIETPFISSPCRVKFDKTWSFDVINSNEEVVYKWMGAISYEYIPHIDVMNGILTYKGDHGTVEIEIGCEEFKIKYNVSHNDTREVNILVLPYINANTYDSIQYLENNKINTSDFNSRIQDIQTSIDDVSNAKLDKNTSSLYADVYGVKDIVLSGINNITPLLGQNQWEVSFVVPSSGASLYMLTNEEISDVPWSTFIPGSNIHLSFSNNTYTADIDGVISTQEFYQDSYFFVKFENLISPITVSLSNNGDFIPLMVVDQYFDVSKADKAEVESSLALKADKTEVESMLSTKIGINDDMLYLPQSNSIVLNNNEESELFGGDYWKIDAYDKSRIRLNAQMALIGDDGVEIFDIDVASPRVIELKDNIIHVYDDNNGSLTEVNWYNSTCSNYKIKAIDGNVYATLTTSQPLNTKESLNYLNENKADKVEVKTSISDINITLDNKLGKFDTVLSVNDGEYNTDYNVEGALGYLQSEIEAMNVIDCGTY